MKPVPRYPQNQDLKPGENVRELVDKSPLLDGNYLVSDQGRLWSMVYGRWMKPQLCPKGYERIEFSLSENGKRISIKRRVHRMVLTSFIGPAPAGRNTGDHINNNKLDNRLKNLQWISREENTMKQIKDGRHPKAKLSEAKAKAIRVKISEGLKVSFIASLYGVTSRTVLDIQAGRTWAA